MEIFLVSRTNLCFHSNLQSYGLVFTYVIMHWQISNTEGELYCLSIRSHNFKWIQDFSSLDKIFTITPGNNGRLYVTVPARALLLAIDASSGTILWQRGTGPLSTAESTPVVDSNGNYVYLNTNCGSIL